MNDRGKYMIETRLRKVSPLVALSILIIIASSGIGQSSEEKIVPNLVGLSEENATKILNELNVSYKILEGHNESVKLGFICDQEPKYLEVLHPGATIKVYKNIPLIKLYIPLEGDHVNNSVLIRGHISPELGENDFLWIGAKPYKDIKNWWPQSNGIIRPFRGGEFEGNAFLGGISNDTFEIGIFIINQSLNDKFNKWLNFATEYNVWPPITKENPGATVAKEVLEAHKYEQVNVTLI
jgi:hypothetical protein